MGFFSYTCEICGGAYKQCGNNTCDQNCVGVNWNQN